MAVKIRLARHGAKRHLYYRIVVADSRARRDVASLSRLVLTTPPPPLSM